MKKHIFFVMALMCAMNVTAQEPVHFTQKLDSVVGSNDFDWTRFKKIFTYYEEDSVILDETYSWENGLWTLSGGKAYQYTTGFQKLLGTITSVAEDTVLTPSSWTDYQYDDLGQLTLVMNYVKGDTSWVESSKYEYSYDEAGSVDTSLYYTIRNGNWRESQRNLYSYDEEHRCTSLRIQSKGGWGPNANQWRDNYRYDFEYEDGELLAEYCYVASGWFGGGDMVLDSKWVYEYDAEGNLLSKTGSVFNEVDWVVRDVYENRYGPSVDVHTVLGLEPFWQTVVDEGMGYTSGADMTLKSQWLSCSIISADRDTEFTLYCSGFAGVDEEQVMPLKAWCSNGRLLVTCEQPSDITVFDLLGRVVASEKQTLYGEFNLTPGLYILGNGNARVKVIVK